MSSRRFIAPPPSDATSTESRLAAIGYNAKLGPGDAEFLLAVAAERTPAWRLRQDRLDRRDEAIRQYAEGHLADLASERSRAKTLASDLALEPVLAPPTDGSHRVALRRILELGDGKVLSEAQVREIIRGGRG